MAEYSKRRLSAAAIMTTASVLALLGLELAAAPGARATTATPVNGPIVYLQGSGIPDKPTRPTPGCTGTGRR